MNSLKTASKGVAQKLITIYLDNAAYSKGKLLVGSYAEKHGFIEEHLSDHLAQGWRVAAIHALGGGTDGLCVRGWLSVLLEMPDAA